MNLSAVEVLSGVLALAAVFLPGLALLAWLPARRRTLAERAAMAFGLGMAMIALVALATWEFGFSISTALFAGALALLAVLTVVGWIRRGVRLRVSRGECAVALAFGLLLALRFFQARDLAFPAWVDSVHHALIVRIFLERAALPADLTPWLPVPFYYHFAVHAATAVFAAVSGWPPDRALLIFGQVLNAMVSLAVFRLSMAIRRDIRIALLAMALSGFVSEMPAYFLSWGRYTLLAGLVLLTLAMAEAVELLRHGLRGSSAVRLAVLTAGTLLAHYLAGLLLALFCVALAIAHLVRRRRGRPLIGCAAAVGVGVLLALPWLVRMLVFSRSAIGLEAGVPFSTEGGVNLFLRLIQPQRHWIFLAVGCAGSLIALFHPKIRPMAIWSLALALLALPNGIRLAPFRFDHLVIVLFLPASILAAWLSWRLADLCAARLARFPVRALCAAAACILCLWGAWDSRDIVNPVTVLATPADRAAIEWVIRNTPEDARFLINTVHWQVGLYRGVDGGWWLLPAAGRTTLLPPAAYTFGDRSYMRVLLDIAQRTSALQPCSPEFHALLREQDVDFVYLREGVGSLQPDGMDKCAGIERIYSGTGVFIYKVARFE